MGALTIEVLSTESIGLQFADNMALETRKNAHAFLEA
jgi:hypothetical protein